MAKHESVWITTSERPEFSVLEDAVDFDVAVLGAGIAGLSTALRLKNAGLRVAVPRPARCAPRRRGIRRRRSALSTA